MGAKGLLFAEKFLDVLDKADSDNNRRAHDAGEKEDYQKVHPHVCQCHSCSIVA